jgi:hypothetical protein
MVDALVETRWIDRSDKHRLVVHDWDQHAPKFIKASVNQNGGFVTANEPPTSPKNDQTLPEVPPKDDVGQVCSDQTGVTDPLIGGAYKGGPIRGGLSNLIKPNQTKPNQSSVAATAADSLTDPPHSASSKTKRKPPDVFDQPWSADVVPLPPDDSGEFARVWAEWVAVRKAKRGAKVFTNRMAKLSIEKLAKAGLTVSQMAKCVHESACGGWDGLFPERITIVGGNRLPPNGLTFKTQEAIAVHDDLDRMIAESRAREEAEQLAANRQPLAIEGGAA